MQQKNIEKEKRKSRPLWVGLKPRKEATKQERASRALKKYKRKEEEEK